MRSDGTVYPRALTGLCSKQQFIIERLVQQAHWSGLFPSNKPAGYDPNVERSGYKAYNRYWEKDSDMYNRRLTTLPGSFYYIRRY
ncbi:unnamed protein product [Soboliphyme baturini]|uniref:28S ribosomal protein S18-2, mitochondrial n=1 Tax=Soboliphyme baturini TaxID=241478 RepID=A0A183J8R0_9BILA|nr:unnamed protein product [Soboliphyme baturini]